jgi:HEAT repeat protein
MAELHPKTRTFVSLIVAAAMTLICATAMAQPRGKAAKAKAKRVRKPMPVKVDFEAQRLVDPSPDVATKGAIRLGETRDARAFEALLDALATGLHPKVAEAALRSLVAHRNVHAYDTLAFYVSYRDARVRAAALAAIGALDDGRVTQFVLAGLRDSDKLVRAEAGKLVAARKLKSGIEPLLELLKKGDEGAVEPLAAMADPDLARTIGEFIGVAPDALLARCLGSILLKTSFKPETARVQVVRSLGKVAGSEAVEQLSSYIDAIPEKPPRQSRREAEAIIEARLTGGM